MEAPNFDREYRVFTEQTYPRHSSGPFTSFSDGAARQWEGYKPKLRQRALTLLAPQSWQQNMIGSGEILEHAIQSIEIGGDEQTRNNLVQWEGRYGPGSAAHFVLKAASNKATTRLAFERWFWSAFRSETDPGTLFEGFRTLAGNGYSLAAYFFFLIDMDRFAPIAPETFDRAFKRLGMPVATSGRCSWENYVEFNRALDSVAGLLALKPALSGVRLIDAHSFLWMMIRMEDEAPNGAKAGPVRFADAKAISIMNMAISATTASAQSGKEKGGIYKDKQVHHERDGLVRIIRGLVERQDARCALTGLPLQWNEDGADPEMRASLDRIDSDGHYVDGNLQVVCRFVNRWKSDSDNGEFRRLLSIIRAQSNEI